MRTSYKFAVGQLVALRHDFFVRFGPMYPAGSIFRITRRFNGYTARAIGSERDCIRKVKESVFRELTEEERVTHGQ
ncbi:MAG: hypothetical protein ACO1SV_27495 [Fimbriimonas sp.]